jgi:excinuclease ABC subunit A
VRRVLVRGARVHNLKNITVEFPREKLIVITGPSGSGKSSLAFDVIYAEGQRRFIESLSAYARQFLPRLPKPDVDAIEGLSPTMCVRQERPNHNPRSTVGTVTEVLDFLRLLYARVGTPHSPTTGKRLERHTTDQMVRHLLALGEGARVTLLAPLGSLPTAKVAAKLAELSKGGFVRARVAGALVELESPPRLVGKGAKAVDVVIDRIVVRADRRERIADSIELAVRTSGGRLTVLPEGGAEFVLTDKFECPDSGFTLPPLEPQLFSFNSPQGACPACGGLGVQRDGEDGAGDGKESKGKGKGRESADDGDGAELAHRFLDAAPCPACNGARLRPEALLVKVGGFDITHVAALPVSELLTFVKATALELHANEVARPVLAELASRVGCLVDVGLDYLSLDRPTSTLSGGEAQRVQLATQIGANLSGVLYVLDEPSIGLHARDTEKLIDTLKTLRDRDNTVLVVEHDEAIMAAADHVIDLGPGAGVLGGEVLSSGTLKDLMQCSASTTADYVSGRRVLHRAPRGRKPTGHIKVRGATRNNLEAVDVDIPLGVFVVVTGVSGSGKSSLIMDTVLRGAIAHLRGERASLSVKSMRGFDAIERVVAVDAAPIGRSARSCPATYSGIFAPMRELFAAIPEARARGYESSRFSFNVKGGRCEVCQGTGVMRIAMHFLPDAEVTCESCEGRRYSRETLDIRYRGLSIADALALTVDEADDAFGAVPDVHGPVARMREVGLGYVRLGQSATTLSGGEAQRLKLAVELARKGAQPTLYVFDEPTTGLHFSDIDALLGVFGRLADAGHSVVVVEHHLDVVASADHVIELGPGGGTAGGRVVATGTPDAIARAAGSPTAPYLRETLRARGKARAPIS